LEEKIIFLYKGSIYTYLHVVQGGNWQRVTSSFLLYPRIEQSLGFGYSLFCACLVFEWMFNKFWLIKKINFVFFFFTIRKILK